MERLKNIKFLQDVESLSEFKGEGNSVDEKFLAVKDGKEYFVKITKNKINSSLKEIFEQAGIRHAKIMDIGEVSGGYYIIQEKLELDSLRSHFDDLSEDEIYKITYEEAQRFSNLRKISPDREMTQDEYENFLKYLFAMLNTFHSAYEKSEVFSVENRTMLLTLRDYLLDNIKELKNCPCVFGHTDIHPGNFLIDDDRLVAIDYDETKHSNIAIAILWGLNSDNIDRLTKYLAFSKGYLNGLFKNKIPQTVCKAVNVSFVFMTIRYVLKYLNSNQFARAEKYLEEAKKFFKGKEVDIKWQR